MNSRLIVMTKFGLILAVFGGCSSYPEQVEVIKNDLRHQSRPGTPIYDIYSDTGGNKLLALQERGRLEQLQGKYRESSTSYAEAIKFSDALEDKALVSIGDALDSTLAVTYGNDLALDYPVLGFERMMLHVLDGFNRLAIGDIDGFGVDMRNLERCRGMIKTRLKRDMEMMEKEFTWTDEYASTASKSYGEFMKAIESLAPGLNHSTDNVYALFLMGLYREIRGDMREALNHYTEVQKIWPKNPAVIKSIERCNGANMDKESGDVIVFFEEGFIPSKRTKLVGFKITDLPTLYMKLPNYATADCLPYEEGGPLVLFEDNRYIAHTQNLCDLAAFAVKAHEERLKGVIARKSLTATMTSGMIGINNEVFNGAISVNPIGEALLLCGGFFTAIAADIMFAASNRPDLRSWCLLPRQIQIARFSAKAGRHDFMLISANKTEKLMVEVNAGCRTIVYCSSCSGKMRCFAAPLDGALIK